jgi:hypothetical protein
MDVNNVVLPYGNLDALEKYNTELMGGDPNTVKFPGPT